MLFLPHVGDKMMHGQLNSDCEGNWIHNGSVFLLKWVQRAFFN